MPLSNFSQIDVPVLSMFAHLPIVDLINVGQVCPLWKDFRRTECHRRRELTILIGPDCDSSVTTNYRYSMPFVKELAALEAGKDTPFSDMVAQLPACNTTNWSCLAFDDLTEENALKLLKTFPNITRLGIIQKRDEFDYQPYPHVSFLLEGWKSSVTSLKMWYISTEVNPRIHSNFGTHVQAQMNSVNSLTALKHFTLKVGFDALSHPFILDLPFLSRLTEFVCHSEFYNGWNISESLNRYAANNEQLQNIAMISTFGFQPPTSEKLLEFVHLKPNFCTKFTYLNTESLLFDLGVSHLDKFCSLTSLLVSLDQSITQFARHLHTLKQLLHLIVYLTPQYSNDGANINLEFIPLLNSVKILTLITPAYHQGVPIFVESFFGRCFPNLMALELWFFSRPFRCPYCDHVTRISNIDSIDRQCMKCIRQLLTEPFDHCTKLRKFRAIPSFSSYHGGVLSEWPIARSTEQSPYNCN